MRYNNKVIRKYIFAAVVAGVIAIIITVLVSFGLWHSCKLQNQSVLDRYPDIAQLISRYGMQGDMYMVNDMNAMKYHFTVIVSIILLVTIFVIIVIFGIYIRNRRKELNILTGYVEQISKGNYALDLYDNSEDELSNLKNQLYKVTISLSEQVKVSKDKKKALADSLSDISHQLKTPLTSISILIDNLNESEDMESEIRKKFLTEISRQIIFLNWMVAVLLKLSRLDAGVVEFNNEQVNIEKMIKEAVYNLEVIAIDGDVRLEIEMPSYITNDFKADGVFIYGDYRWNLEAVQNIIKNAIEHSPKYSTVSIKVEKNSVYTAIYVINSGNPISREEQKHIFERFYKSADASENSVGIGLSLAKSIIEKQNGYVYVDSTCERTCFIIKYITS